MEGLIDGGDGGCGLLFLEAVVSVTLGAEVEGGGAAEEAAVVGAEKVAFRGLAAVLLRHGSPTSKKKWTGYDDSAQAKNKKPIYKMIQKKRGLFI